MKNEVVQEITNQILESLQDGNIPAWELPWHGEVNLQFPVNESSQNLYAGINTWSLMIQAKKNKFLSNRWLTFNQAKDLGGTIRKGSKGSKVVFYKLMQTADKNEKSGEVEAKKFPLLRYTTVFNLCQVEGFEDEIIKGADQKSIEKRTDIDLNRTGATFIHEPSLRAYYSPQEDLVKLPSLSLFKSQDDFYATTFHELIHWTGHKTRLDRPLGNGFGTKSYAFEELVAEFGASYLCAHYGFKYSTQHASYIQSWAQVIDNDGALILKATSKAHKAAQFLINLIDGVVVKEEVA